MIWHPQSTKKQINHFFQYLLWEIGQWVKRASCSSSFFHGTFNLSFTLLYYAFLFSVFVYLLSCRRQFFGSNTSLGCCLYQLGLPSPSAITNLTRQSSREMSYGLWIKDSLSRLSNWGLGTRNTPSSSGISARTVFILWVIEYHTHKNTCKLINIHWSVYFSIQKYFTLFLLLMYRILALTF